MLSFEHPRVPTYGSVVPYSHTRPAKGTAESQTSTHLPHSSYIPLCLVNPGHREITRPTQLPRSSYNSQFLVNPGQHQASWTSSESGATSGDLRTSSESANVSSRLCDVAVKATRHTLRYHVGAEV